MRKQEVNCIFAIHFDDKDDPRYQEIVKIMTSTDMWQNKNLVYAAHLDSREQLTEQLERLEYNDE